MSLNKASLKIMYGNHIYAFFKKQHLKNMRRASVFSCLNQEVLGFLRFNTFSDLELMFFSRMQLAI